MTVTEINGSTSVEAPPKASAREAWATVYTTLLAAGIVPLAIKLHPGDIDITIELRADRPADVDRALQLLGLPEGGPWVHLGTDAHRWSKDEPGEYIAYGLYCAWQKAAAVPGWYVNVHCDIHTQQAAVK